MTKDERSRRRARKAREEQSDHRQERRQEQISLGLAVRAGGGWQVFQRPQSEPGGLQMD